MAKVSRMTVSLALRGDPSISEKTRKKVKKIADLLGYVPDPMLTALSSYRKRTRPAVYQANIAWLNQNPQPANLIWGDFTLYFMGAAARARELGYILEEITLTGENANPKHLRRLLDARSITGLLLAPAWVTGSEFKCDLSRYSIVRLGFSYRAPLVHTVANSQFRTALLAMQKAVELGYRRIGIILNREVDERTSWHFLGGYLAGQHLLSEKDRLAPFYSSFSYPFERLVEHVHAWISKEKIDCLLGTAHHDLYRALVERGMEIPARVGYADMQIAENDEFFSGIHQNARHIGRAAVDLLVSMMHQHTTGIPVIPQHLLIEGSWRLGKTMLARHPRKPSVQVGSFPGAAPNFE